MTCLITGCVATDGGRWVGGDLHRIGDCFVFNAILKGGESAWGTREEWSHYNKEIDFSEGGNYWERRGTIVAPVGLCRLNQAAQEYLE